MAWSVLRERLRDEDLDPARRSSSAPAAARDKFQTRGALIFFFFFFFFCSLINSREGSPVLHPGNISVHVCGSVGNECRRSNVEFTGSRGKLRQPLLQYLKAQSAHF